MDERKATIASNLIRLRLAAGMTQAEVGEKLSYSDKTISKWERGEVTTDVFVLTEIAALFDVTIDYLLTPHTEVEPIIYNRPKTTVNTHAITAISLLGIWTLALLVFIMVWLAGFVVWQIFLYAVPASLITLLVMRSVFFSGRHNAYIIAALVISLLLSVYLSLLTFTSGNPWQLLLLAAPACGIVWLASLIKRRK